MAEEDRPRLRCFLAVPFSREFEPLREAVKKGVDQASGRIISLESSALGGSLFDALLGELARADCVIADVSNQNPNVYYELGLAQAMGKGIFLVAHKDMTGAIPVDLRGFRVLMYETSRTGFAALSSKITESLREYRKAPRRQRFMAGLRPVTPFFVDWDRLDRSEAENLCRELLAQLGYVRVDWAKEIPELDLIAELPKKDPDGFEYRELWLVAMGGKAPQEMIFEWLERGPEYLFHRLMRRGDGLAERLLSRGQGAVPVTFLFIFAGSETGRSDDFERMRSRFGEQGRPFAFKGEFSGTGFRFRFWDRNYLTSLVQQFPQIGFKYFSDEGRSRSKYRKTPEELYEENVALGARMAKLIQDLEEEKNRRVRAERDAVWKDISFAAAHKIGNPIFAIETDLDPLQKRVLEGRTDEAIEVVGNLRSSVDKAKAIIDQFKSLTRAQQITAIPTPLRPILEEACKTAKTQHIVCRIDCPEDLLVQGDAERLAECFDELTVNATHWLDKAKKVIQISAVRAISSALPADLDTTREYALVHFKDNGIGIPLENKTKIFDAFFTTHDHGTGLGLALVRRIIEGHGGTILETGIPAHGADFEIYLPLAATNNGKSEAASPARGRNKK